MDKSRTGMGLLLILLWPCVWGMPHHEVEEGENLTLKWNCPQLLDLSALDVDCRFISNNSNLRMLYMVKGGESEWDDRFSGRVQCVREALKQGRVRIVFSRLTPLDSGEYTCDMHAAKSGSWRFAFHEHFVIDVLPSMTTTAATTPGGKSTPVSAVTKQPETIEKIKMTLLAVGIALPLTFVVVIGYLFYVCKQKSELEDDQPSTAPPPDDATQSNLTF